MIQDAALDALGLNDDASPAEIKEAITRKQAQLQQALDKAPTEVLQNKYRDQLAKLQELQAKLLAPQGRASHLSRTKLADLPQSATHFDGGQSAQVHLHPGQWLANRYEIKQLIGAGGMGAVYHAFDSVKLEDVALKVLLPALLANERARQRFLDEARISAKLSHPNIVNVFDVQHDGDFFFLTMELLEGQDLRQLMEARQLTRQPFDEEEARTLAVTLANALAYAHRHTVHRDIKPENIWVTETGDYKIMDFGIARVQSTSQRTQTGAAMGTAYYMAPEQLKGTSTIDGRADQYALGVLLYELLAGEVPAGRFKPLRELRKDLSKGFAASVEKALETRAEDRFADIPAFAQALVNGKGGRFELELPWKKLGIAAGALVTILGIGGLAASGSFDLGSLKNLLPMSKEEIAAQKAGLAKIQGEIKVIKQRLDNARRSLDSDVRDAERNKDQNVFALEHWQRITEDAIFAGSQLTELEGNLAMAETLLRDNAFAQAAPVFEQVRGGYQQLQENFEAGEKLYSVEQTAMKTKSEWQTLAADYGLNNPPQVAQAEASMALAKQQQQSGELFDALNSWQQSLDDWQSAHNSVADEVAQISSERSETRQRAEDSAKAIAERRARAERQIRIEKQARIERQAKVNAEWKVKAEKAVAEAKAEAEQNRSLYEKSNTKSQSRNTPTMRESAIKYLGKAQDAANTQNWSTALAVLKEMEASKDKLNGYEVAQMYYFYGYVYYSMEKYPEAITYYKKVLQQGETNLPVTLEVGTLLTTAQLYFVTEDYKQAVDYLNKWFAVSGTIGADSYALRGQAYYQLGDNNKALADMNKAVSLYELEGEIPKENWFGLQRFLYYSFNDYKQVTKILEKLVNHYPKGDYYKELAGMYGELKRESDMFHMMEFAYAAGALQKEKELLNMAYLYMKEDEPYNAAEIIEKGIKDKRIEATSKNLETLANAWAMAHDLNKSILALEKAVTKEKSGDAYARLAAMYMDNDMFDEAVDTGKIALKMGGVKREDHLYVVMGMAYIKQQKYDDAIKAFDLAAKDSRSKELAEKWRLYAQGKKTT